MQWIFFSFDNILDFLTSFSNRKTSTSLTTDQRSWRAHSPLKIFLSAFSNFLSCEKFPTLSTGSKLSKIWHRKVTNEMTIKLITFKFFIAKDVWNPENDLGSIFDKFDHFLRPMSYGTGLRFLRRLSGFHINNESKWGSTMTMKIFQWLIYWYKAFIFSSFLMVSQLKNRVDPKDIYK